MYLSHPQYHSPLPAKPAVPIPAPLPDIRYTALEGMAASRLRFPVCSVNVQFQVHRFLLPLFYCSTQGNPSHNTCYEYFFKYLKKEETNRKCYHSLQELQLSIFEYIEGYYNSKRPHSIYLLQTKQKLSIRSRICKAVPDYFFTFLSTSLTVL